MKNIFCCFLIFFGAAVFCAAEGIAEESRKGKEKVEMSYAFGMVVASDLVETGLEFNYNSFIRGFREVLEKQETRYTMEEAMDMIQAAYEAAQTRIGDRNREEGEAYLAENGKRSGVITTSSGLQYEVISQGNSSQEGGEKPGPQDTVQVHYRGTTLDGNEFDNSYERGEPVEFPLDGVIRGWTEGLQLMSVGSTYRFVIPPNLAYGSRGAGSAIGPHSTIIFEVELLAIVRPPEDDE